MDGRVVPQKDCYLRSLDLDETQKKLSSLDSKKKAVAWTNVGMLGGGKVNGTLYSAKECYEEALAAHFNNVEAWLQLGSEGGGRPLKGRLFSEKDCYIRALSLDETNPTLRKGEKAFSWTKLGILGAGNVKGKAYSEKDCYLAALSLQETPMAWFHLGLLGGGEVNGRVFSEKECYQKSVSLDEDFADAWAQLATVDGGDVHGRSYSTEECLAKAKYLRENPFIGIYSGPGSSKSPEKGTVQVHLTDATTTAAWRW